MKSDSLFDLIRHSLPPDVDPDRLRKLARDDWWRERPFLACAYALRKCASINWDAYKARYNDVATSRLDPVLHFLKHGVFEGRRLISHNPHCEPTPPRNILTPEISIVVVNQHNGIFLEKCLQHLINQTLKNIEIVVVNECSDREAAELTAKCAWGDDRVKHIILDRPYSLHMARKAGATKITGRYAMFLNPRDMLEPNACGQILKEMEKGEDMMAFRRGKALYGNTSRDDALWHDHSVPDSYNGFAKLDLCFCERTLDYTLASKVVTAPLAKMCFAIMEDGDFAPYEDIYEFLVLAFYARTLRKSPIQICKSLIYPDVIHSSAGVDISGGNFTADLAVLDPFSRFCTEHKLDRHCSNFKNFMLEQVCKNIVSLSRSRTWDYIGTLADYFGTPEAVYQLSQTYQRNPGVIASLLAGVPKQGRQTNDRKLGIYYYRMTAGGLERSIQNICRLLIPLGYEITLLLVEKSDRDLPLPDAVHKIYVADSRAWQVSGKEHLADMHKALARSGIETLMYMDVHSQSYLWDSVLAGIMGIDVIGSIRLDHVFEYLRRSATYTHTVVLDTMKMSGKVICLNTSTEIYLRAQGVDAECVPNAIQNFRQNETTVKRGNNVVVVARLGDQTKQIGECLKTLAALVNLVPDAKMLFVGSFDDDAQKSGFYAKAASLNLESHIEVSGWIVDPAPFFARAKALFSASFLEGFPNGIAEAQASGLPVVMYDLDIELARCNESVIMVPQYACKDAASELARLLLDDGVWQRLSCIARQQEQHFSEERFATDMDRLLSTLHSQSRLKYYTDADYQRAIGYAAFYAGKGLPRNGFN